ncbi:MAG: rhomboid family intramembrane serine protease [Candidatus Thermoplasmatota archaeon]|nr:rhomboid family intramembrane serine protease [Euryarchaeota archaeon]MBU4032538.1 rhomboid family intramembrane serine protease [Candidatus Thermoplasmatota archaeon]MBU4072011.1 rhomboid family intramembrane serine protease [Candidatus Thermoplasmatota archaeon]MBU4144542.1 rhomboid family intramembrane serine protease [Candidatus Thermoplasmatota archaeon]MBU4592091.1 rhomboid family intramembrane serine protease [Candidatus Thermoplasmatota archaeon]
MLEYIPIPAIIIGSLAYAWWRKAYLTQVMVIANFFIFIYVFVLDNMASPLHNDMINAFTFMPSKFGDPLYIHTIFTSMFMHAHPFHLIGNVLVLYLIGLPLEERIGSKNWGIIYLVTGIAATMLFWLFHMSAYTYLLGASGAIFGIGGALLILYPRDRIPMFLGPIFSMRAPVWAAVGIMFVMETILVAMAVDDGTAHIAHVGGIVCGIFLAPILVRKATLKKKAYLDFDLLRKMALRPEDLQVLEKIENETEPDVRKAWLEFFMKEAARCPKCRRRLGESYAKDGKNPANEKIIECACGQSYDIWK